MTDTSPKEKKRLEREARLAQNLRSNLRRRKAVAKKSTVNSTAKPDSASEKVTNPPESP